LRQRLGETLEELDETAWRRLCARALDFDVTLEPRLADGERRLSGFRRGGREDASVALGVLPSNIGDPPASCVVVAHQLRLGYSEDRPHRFVREIEDRQPDDSQPAHAAHHFERRDDRRIGVSKELAPRSVAV